MPLPPRALRRPWVGRPDGVGQRTIDRRVGKGCAMSLPEIKSCPFCGANDGLTMTDGSTYRWGYAYCSNCGASAGEVRRAYPDDGKWHEEAIHNWNQRAAPQRREWVGLTEEEILEASRDHYNPHQRAEVSFACAIEAKLRKKNGGGV